MDIKNCKYCNEQIPKEAKRCIYCGSILDDLIQKQEQSEIQAQNPSDDERISYIVPANIMTVSNGIKVLLTALVCVIPIIGQLFGIIVGLILMTYKDFDRKTLGRSIINVSMFLFFLISIIMTTVLMYAKIDLQRFIQ